MDKRAGGRRICGPFRIPILQAWKEVIGAIVIIARPWVGMLTGGVDDLQHESIKDNLLRGLENEIKQVVRCNTKVKEAGSIEKAIQSL